MEFRVVQNPGYTGLGRGRVTLVPGWRLETGEARGSTAGPALKAELLYWEAHQGGPSKGDLQLEKSLVK